ncbi:MAG: ATP-binding protein [Nocardioidaceae bacterium]
MIAGRHGGTATARVRMVAQPASVPAVRRFVDEALTEWGCETFIDDVGLSVTELATNATLHSSSTFFEVELEAAPDVVRVAVLDKGTLPAEFIARRSCFEAPVDGNVDLDEETMTGRGLFIVSALADQWGIDDLPDGTRVWAEFGVTTGGYVAQRPVVSGSAPREPRPAESAVVRLDGCPPDLLLAHDDNLADIVRELRLVGTHPADPEAARAAGAIALVVQQSALSWGAARLTARQALLEGRDTVDIAIAVLDPATLPDKIRVLRECVGTAEAMAAAGELITMPAPEPVQVLRDWFEQEMVQQVTTGREPISYPAFLAERAGRPPRS